MGNQVNRDPEASSNETIKLSISFTVAYDVLSSGYYAIYSEEQICKKSAEQKEARY